MLLAQMLLMAARKSYQQVILADKPVAFWPLNETSGTVANDISGNGNNAAYQNAPTLGAAPLAAGLGPSITLNGSNQYVELATPPTLLQIVEGSFEAWVNLTATPDGGGLFTAAYTGSGTVNFAIAFGSSVGAASGDLPFIGSYTSSALQGEQDTTALTNSTTYHIVGTFNGSTYSLYINGVLIGTASGASITPNANAIYMGRRWDTAGTDSFLEASISNFAMYSTVLTATQVKNHYNAGIA